MSAGMLPPDIKTIDQEESEAEKKLGEILEWRLGRYENNQAIINDCKLAGLSFSARVGVTITREEVLEFVCHGWQPGSPEDEKHAAKFDAFLARLGL